MKVQSKEAGTGPHDQQTGLTKEKLVLLSTAQNKLSESSCKVPEWEKIHADLSQREATSEGSSQIIP